MKKQMILCLAGLMLLFSACGTSAAGEDRTLDLEDMAEQILDSGVFEEPLNEAEDGIAELLYGITDAVDSHLYVASGAVADELALFEFEDEESAGEAVELAEARVSSQRESFASYLPAEVTKLDDAVIEVWGRYLIVCVSGDPGASLIISEYLEQDD